MIFLFTCEFHYGLGVFLLFNPEPVEDLSYLYLAASTKHVIVTLVRREARWRYLIFLCCQEKDISMS